jgi:hypothetical protein
MNSRFSRMAVLSLFSALAGTASPLFYNVNLSIGATGHVVGFIETDGTLGTLAAPNFLDWKLTISDGVHTTDTLTGPLSGNNSTITVNLSDQSATASKILFNFSALDNGYFFFEGNVTPDFVCFGGGGAGGFQGVCAVGVASNVEGISLGGAEQNTPLTGSQAVAVPEPATMGLLTAGLAIGFLKRRIRRA